MLIFIQKQNYPDFQKTRFLLKRFHCIRLLILAFCWKKFGGKDNRPLFFETIGCCFCCSFYCFSKFFWGANAFWGEKVVLGGVPYSRKSGLWTFATECLCPWIQSAENHRKECHQFWLRLRHAVILISNVRGSASKKINRIALIWTLMVLTTAFERTKEKFCGFRQTE